MTHLQSGPASLDVQLLIDGVWRPGADRVALPITNPATARQIGQVACAADADLHEAVTAAARGFAEWRAIPAFDRSRVLRRAAQLLRERSAAIGSILTLEQGKPLAQAIHEVSGSADSIDWFAEEGKRAFGQVIPGRKAHTNVLTRLEPVGPVAAFTPWNFPVSQSVKKLAAALAAGCSVVLKGSEDTPASCAEMMRSFVDAGVPRGALGLLYGNPAAISNFLVPHPIIRAVSFTGSVPVGKLLAAQAGAHMKRLTMELGGHAPVIICEDADLEMAAASLLRMKFMNAGQVCLAPTRFLVARSVYLQFVELFTRLTQALRVGDGHADGTEMGPLISQRRLQAVAALVNDAVGRGARLACGGVRMEGPGFFYAPTILADVPLNARAMNEEPFGPLALMRPFDDLEEALLEANRLPYGLAAYVFTRSIRNEALLTENLEAGMIAVNQIFPSMIEAPFGGVKESGYGTEGGTRAIFNFLNEKMISRYVG